MRDRFDTPISAGARAQIPVEPTLAGAGSRLAARLVDLVLVSCALIPSAALVLALGGGRALAGRPDVQVLALLPALALLVALSLYQWSSTATDGTTIGKRLLGIRIERDDGKPPGFVKGVVLRSWLFTVGSGVLTVITCVGGVGLLAADALFVLSGDSRCLHDRVAGTRVVEE